MCQRKCFVTISPGRQIQAIRRFPRCSIGPTLGRWPTSNRQATSQRALRSQSRNWRGSRHNSGALVFTTGSAEEMVANCDLLITEWSSTALVGLALNKEVDSMFKLEELRRLVPMQTPDSASNIAEVCRSLVMGYANRGGRPLCAPARRTRRPGVSPTSSVNSAGEVAHAHRCGLWAQARAPGGRHRAPIRPSTARLERPIVALRGTHTGDVYWVCPPGRCRNITSQRATVWATSGPRSSSTSARARSIPAVTPALVQYFPSLDVDRVRVDTGAPGTPAARRAALRPVGGDPPAVQEAGLLRPGTPPCTRWPPRRLPGGHRP